MAAEFDYIAQTAIQANEDRARVSSFYMVAVGSLVEVESGEPGGIADPRWQTVSQSLAKDLGIPATHVLLTATHTHSAGPRSPNYA